MKKLIEFQEVKHGEVIDIINQFRADTGVTFSEAVRRLILLSQNGADPGNPECITYTTEDKRIDDLEEKLIEKTAELSGIILKLDERSNTIEEKVETLVKVSKLFKKYMEEENDGRE